MKRLRVWWIPQVPMQPFYVDVDTVRMGVKIMDVLGRYDDFQFRKHIKPDYSNAGGLIVWDEELDPDENGEKWTDWYDPQTGMELDEYFEAIGSGELIFLPCPNDECYNTIHHLTNQSIISCIICGFKTEEKPTNWRCPTCEEWRSSLKTSSGECRICQSSYLN